MYRFTPVIVAWNRIVGSPSVAPQNSPLTMAPASTASSMTWSSLPGLGNKDQGLVPTDMMCDLPSLPVRLQAACWPSGLAEDDSVVEGNGPTKSESPWSTVWSPRFIGL